jgi:hypothetical protein
MGARVLLTYEEEKKILWRFDWHIMTLAPLRFCSRMLIVPMSRMQDYEYRDVSKYTKATRYDGE